MTRVEFHPEALIELENIHRWCRKRSQLAARTFTKEVVQVIRRISESPQSGTQTRENERRYLFKRFPYSIVYRVVENEVFITAIAHQKRRPGYWRKRT